MARVIHTVQDMRNHTTQWRENRQRIGLVPTMGALHNGHLSLIKAAQQHCDRVIVSIFVNPTQFAPNEDLDSYPRQESTDIHRLQDEGVDAVFMPPVAEMYPEHYATTVSMTGPAKGLETNSRPHFFQGVATVVAKLLLATNPHQAFFGEKDYQQLMVIKQLVDDLHIPVEITGCPTVRDSDGLALSSRNQYLSAAERKQAIQLYKTLQSLQKAWRGQQDMNTAIQTATQTLLDNGFSKVDYLSICQAHTLKPTTDFTAPARILGAAWLGNTRLIDNIEG